MREKAAMKILWMSDSPFAATGLGNVTSSACTALAKLGFDVSILGWQNRGPVRRWRNCILYPAGKHICGADVLIRTLERVKPDVLVTFADAWRVAYVAGPRVINTLRRHNTLWALYYILDCDTGKDRIPPSMVRFLRTVDLPVAASRFGLRMANAYGIKAAYVPHDIDTGTFKPPANKTVAKRKWRYEDKFVVLCDARNQIRKILPRTLEIFRLFALDKPNAVLHMHCDPSDTAARSDCYSYDILADIALLRLKHKVRFTPGYSIDRPLSIRRLASLYQAADVHLLTSFGEGFGVPTLQAAASGVVPLAPDNTANTELVKGHGYALKVERYARGQLNERCALVDIEDAVEKLNTLYADRDLLARRSRASRRFALAYDSQRVGRMWKQVMQTAVRNTRVVSKQRHRVAGRSLKNDTDLSGELQVAIRELEKMGGHLAADILRDLVLWDSPFTIPATPGPRGGPRITRTMGLVYLAGPADIPVFRALKRVFPCLHAWSATRIKSPRVRVKLVPKSRLEFHTQFDRTTLVIDSTGASPWLSTIARKSGIPLIGTGADFTETVLTARNILSWSDMTRRRNSSLRQVERRNEAQ